MVLFPLMGILDTETTCMMYMKETMLMFIGGLIIALAVEHCNLHKRVALKVISLIGCSQRRWVSCGDDGDGDIAILYIVSAVRLQAFHGSLSLPW